MAMIVSKVAINWITVIDITYTSTVMNWKRWMNFHFFYFLPFKIDQRCGSGNFNEVKSII